MFEMLTHSMIFAEPGDGKSDSIWSLAGGFFASPWAWVFTAILAVGAVITVREHLRGSDNGSGNNSGNSSDTKPSDTKPAVDEPVQPNTKVDVGEGDVGEDKKPNIFLHAASDTINFFGWLFSPSKPDKPDTVRAIKHTTTIRTKMGADVEVEHKSEEWEIPRTQQRLQQQQQRAEQNAWLDDVFWGTDGRDPDAEQRRKANARGQYWDEDFGAYSDDDEFQQSETRKPKEVQEYV